MTPARGPALSGLPVAMVRVWWAPCRVVRGLSPMAEPSLLAMLMLAMGLFLIAQVPVRLAEARADPSIPAEVRLGGAALSVMFLMPLAAYAVAALSAGLSGLAGRWTGGRRRLPGPDARLALFWALIGEASQSLANRGRPPQFLRGEYLQGSVSYNTTARAIAAERGY